MEKLGGNFAYVNCKVGRMTFIWIGLPSVGLYNGPDF